MDSIFFEKREIFYCYFFYKIMSSYQLIDFDKGQIVAYANIGMSQRQIAKELSKSHTCIGKFLNKYHTTNSWKRKHGSGRKRLFIVDEETKIVKLVRKNRKLSTQQIKTDLISLIAPPIKQFRM